MELCLTCVVVMELLCKESQCGQACAEVAVFELFAAAVAAVPHCHGGGLPLRSSTSSRDAALQLPHLYPQANLHCWLKFNYMFLVC